jgi:primosomal protein N' (replication factor Y) (superfamily II helicase)
VRFFDVALPIPRTDPLTYAAPAGREVRTGKSTSDKKRDAAQNTENTGNIADAENLHGTQGNTESPQIPIGSRVIVPVGRRTATGFVVAHRETLPDGVATAKEISRVITSEPLFDLSYIPLARWVSGMYLCSLGEALSAMIPGGKREMAPPETAMPDNEYLDGINSLTSEQAEAVERISAGSGDLHYLYGVTGSGKTEVFLAVAARMIEQGKGVIYLVPEIALSHQMTGLLRRRFGDSCAILHSRLTPSQRLSEWTRIRSGTARFVLGARSAVFAPVENLGLIVLDEEHETSYKSSSHPRYHARQVAMKRAALENACLVMGSATPSVEAWNLMRSGGLNEIRLAGRVGGGRLPEIVVQDLRKEASSIGRELEREIRLTASMKRQSILFLNRRGFAYFFHCKSCGFQMTCRRCSVPLTFHKNRNAMICHYCGYQTAPITVCPNCRSLDLGYSGFGTEKVEEDLVRLFPDLVVKRLDTDTARRKGELESRLEAFRSGAVDILVGTQMVAKGLNFPGVRLVGIVAADTGLQIPDFRAAERTFSLIVQVAGRAGRYAPDGKVIVQTFRPHHEAIRLAAEGNLEEFYRKEIEIRRELGFPPHLRLARIVFRGKNQTRTLRDAEGVTGALRDRLGGHATVLGPAECPIAVISAQYRYQCIVRATQFGLLHAALRTALSRVPAGTGVYREIDIDPVSLM